MKGSFKPKLQNITIGHVPIEISRIVLFSSEHGGTYELKVLEPRPVKPPLIQGGLEIKCNV